MLKNFISIELKNVLENDFNIEILYYEQWKDQNGYTEEDAYNYAAYCGDEVFLGKYDDPRIEILCLFHEIGHIKSNKESIGIYPCKLYQECMAWDYGKKLIVQYKNLIQIGLNFEDYYSKENEFMRKNLKSYLNSEYNDLDR